MTNDSVTVPILLRLAPDLTVKSDRIRAKFVTRMLTNLRSAAAAHGIKIGVRREWSRIFVDVAPSDQPTALELLGRTFGIASYSPVDDVLMDAPLTAIVARGAELFREQVRGKTFAVRARRVGTHDYTSSDLARQLGHELRPDAAGVDLGAPEVEVFVEVRQRATYFFSRVLPGPGGLPLGVGGRALCLVSGGFDSAVAAYLLMKRGIELDFVFFNLAGQAYERAVLGGLVDLTRRWAAGAKPKLHVIDFEPLAAAIRQEVRGSHAQVVLKRCFYRAAAALAQEIGALALVTGESLGQVSSQTLQNLCTIETVTELPVLRPLLGWDKEEILAVARRIGTFERSAKIKEYCQLVRQKPVTACSPGSAAWVEGTLDLGLVTTAVAGRRLIDLRRVTAVDLVGPYLYVDQIPERAEVIFCAEPEDGAGEQPADVADLRRLELHEILAEPSPLAATGTYVFFCDRGLQSAVAAERLQTRGYEAYGFRGDRRALAAALALRAKEKPISLRRASSCGEEHPW